MSELQKSSLDRKMNRLGALVDSLEKLSNPAARIVAQELVQTLLSLHRAGLARMLEIAQHADGAHIIGAYGEDDLVGGLLMLHGLHPVSLDTRVRRAFVQIQPVLRCQGGELELVAVAEHLVRVRVRGTCLLSPQELEHTLQEAFASIAPDVRVVEVENETRAQRVALPVLS